MTNIQQQKSSPLAVPLPSPSQPRRRKNASSQEDIVTSDSGESKPLSQRRWKDPETLLFLLVAPAYLVMAGWNFLKTDSPLMPTIILFYAGAYLRLNLVPILPTLKEFIQEWMRQQRK
jgi:hypothetical protein